MTKIDKLCLALYIGGWLFFAIMPFVPGSNPLTADLMIAWLLGYHTLWALIYPVMKLGEGIL